MPDRTSVASTLWLTSALVLLAAMLVAPVPTSGVVTVSSRTGGPRCDFAWASVGVGKAIATNTALKVNVLPVEHEQQDENEEQDQDEVLDVPCGSFLILCGLHKLSARQLIAPHSVLSLYHLRC